MNDYLMEARDELKRLEHIIYVSLKYTRTVDVLAGAVKRLVSIFDWIIEGLLVQAQEEEKIETLPKSPARRSNQLGGLYTEDEQLQKFLRFYLQIRNILTLPHEKRREFRRHVTLIAQVENMTIEVDSDNVINCERYAHKFLDYAWDKVGEVAPDNQDF